MITITCDGSAGADNQLGAWCAVIDHPHGRKVLFGMLTHTTVNRCELTPIIEALRWARAELPPAALSEITVISDSQVTVRIIDGSYAAKANPDLWRVYREFSQGLNVTALWSPRNTTEAQSLCDGVAYTLYKTAEEMSAVLKPKEDPCPTSSSSTSATPTSEKDKVDTSSAAATTSEFLPLRSISP